MGAGKAAEEGASQETGLRAFFGIRAGLSVSVKGGFFLKKGPLSVCLQTTAAPKML